MKVYKKTNYFYVVIAILLILISTGLLLNWNNLFRPALTPQTFIKSGSSLLPYKIAVYYFPGQKNAARALSYYFEQKNYLVDLLPAKGIAKLQHKKYSPSHIFFKQEEMAQAMSVKSEIGSIIGHPINAYRFSEPPSDVSMIVVFTNN